MTIKRPVNDRRAWPLIVGCENQLIEWVLQDAGRWKPVSANIWFRRISPSRF